MRRPGGRNKSRRSGVFRILYPATCFLGMAGCRQSQDLAPLADLRLRIEAEIPSPFRGTCGELRWSPDGSQLAMAGPGGVYLSAYPPDGPSKRIIEIEPAIYDLIWTADGRTLVVGRSWMVPTGPPGERTSELIAIDVSSGNARTLRSEAGFRYVKLLSLKKSYFATLDGVPMPSRIQFMDSEGNEISRSVVGEFDVAWLAADGLWAIRAGSDEPRRIPFTSQIYGNAHSSPRQARIALETQVDQAVRPVVIDHEGKTERVLPIGFMIGMWSADGRFLIGCELQDDGHTLTGGEVGLLDAESGEYVLLTSTPDRIEYGVDWCEATGRVVYCDYDQRTIHVGVLERRPDTSP